MVRVVSIGVGVSVNIFEVETRLFGIRTGRPVTCGLTAWFGALTMAAAMPAQAWAAGDAGIVDEVRRRLVELFSTIRSYSATITTVEKADSGDGSSIRSESRKRVEWKRSGGRFLYRAEGVTTVSRTGGASSTVEQTKSTTVSDGVHVVTITEQSGETRATKSPADVTTVPDPGLMLDQLREDQTLQRLPDVKVGLHDCYVIQVVPKNRRDSDISQSVIYFRKDLGLDIRTIVYDKKNQPIYTSTTTDIVINPELAADRFQVVLPDGVELVDQTRNR